MFRLVGMILGIISGSVIFVLGVMTLSAPNYQLEKESEGFKSINRVMLHDGYKYSLSVKNEDGEIGQKIFEVKNSDIESGILSFEVVKGDKNNYNSDISVSDKITKVYNPEYQNKIIITLDSKTEIIENIL